MDITFSGQAWVQNFLFEQVGFALIRIQTSSTNKTIVGTDPIPNISFNTSDTSLLLDVYST